MNMTAESAMSFLQETVKRGSSLYNYGYPELCAEIYEAALETVSAAYGMPAGLNETIAWGLDQADNVSQSPEQHAWALRTVVDAAMETVQLAATSSDGAPDEKAQREYLMTLLDTNTSTMGTSNASYTRWLPRGLNSLFLGVIACTIVTFAW